MQTVNVLKQDLERARYLMKVAAEFIMEHAEYETKFYDGTTCDGGCLNDELMVQSEMIGVYDE